MNQTTKRRSVRSRRGSSIPVTRREFRQLTDTVTRRSATIEEHAAVLLQIHHDLEVQFKRIAQIQQELDDIKKAGRKT